MNGEATEETGITFQSTTGICGTSEQGGGGALSPTAQKKTLSALVTWITAHPRAVLWLIIAALLPYLVVCWGVALTVAQALAAGSCGG